MPGLELSAFRNDPATDIISLGSRCATAHNTRRFFDFTSGYPFDWWITPIEAIVGVLARPDPDFLYDPDHLQPTNDRHTVTHRTLGMALHHEFPRDYKEPGKPIKLDFLDHLAKPKARTAYLLDKLLKLNQPDRRILFIRERQYDGEDASHLTTTLSALFPAPEWTIAVVGPVSADNTGAEMTSDWRGSQAAWDAALREACVRLDPLRHPPFRYSEPGKNLSD